MRLRSSSSRKKYQTEEFGDGKARKQAVVVEGGEAGQSAEREARFRIYSCVFCEFVRDNLPDMDLGEEDDEEVYDNDAHTSEAFEAKYLYHLSSVHGLRR